ncbi:hypothetical protein VCHA56P521_210067 [Vibrio chagasii]|nr:hypothetical protein VCHA54P499_110097 [Vibrio chagasii]CAH7060948.1 hypothetical protein VCHA52P461_170011 [Vibrio chagasii]CAH7098012.1 hypothetical protein VCHA48P434_10456 [Vibrio chagasii]CAH7192103.1 hypothetical protein VCHA40O235_20452 [Vibrio chagasii]CAH7225020.1 hypothetical protein VCHA39O220_30393 [Vibrio chagasii]
MKARRAAGEGADKQRGEKLDSHKADLNLIVG